MEYLNKVVIVGKVGNITIQEIGGKERVAHLSVKTESTQVNVYGTQCVESAWHNVTVKQGDAVTAKDLNRIVRGSWVRITGRISYHSYTGPDGSPRLMYEIVVNKMRLLEDDDV